MTTAFHVLARIDLRRVVSAKVELVMDTGEVVTLPAVHSDREFKGPRKPTTAPRYSRKVYRGKGKRR